MWLAGGGHDTVRVAGRTFPVRRLSRPGAVRSIYVPADLYHLQNPRAEMTIHLPHADRAVLDIRKIEDYCLSPTHPRGRHKARIFRQTLNVGRDDAGWLRDVLLEAARKGDATQFPSDAWGSHWRIDATLERHGKSAVVRSIWIVRTGEAVPRFVTCWVL